MSGVALLPRHYRIELSKSQASGEKLSFVEARYGTQPSIRAYTRFCRETALQLRECIQDISCTTARCVSASMAPRSG